MNGGPQSERSMDLSKLKLELYDILAVVLPGFLLLCGLWVLLRGWHGFAISFGALSGTGFTAMLLASFPIGHIVQEAGEVAITKFRGKRYFKAARDEFWQSEEGQNVRGKIEREVGFKVSVDTAFDFCLTQIKGQFPRRDVFLATSDFCRSLLVVGFLLIPTAVRLLWDVHGGVKRLVLNGTAMIFALGLFLYLAGRRMARFRGLSERPVFTTYIASSGQPQSTSPLAQEER
jgi:hypothetical protein